MTTLLIVSVVALALIIVGGFAMTRHGLGWGHRKVAADGALRKLYGQYWAEVRAATQTHLLEAPDDEEWLAGIRERALYAGPAEATSGRSADRLDTHRSPAWHTAAKRAIDIAAASISLPLLAPVLLTVAIIIRLEDGGPVIYRHRVIGSNGVQIDILKFRTIVPKGGTLFKSSNDPRVTRIGRILRAASLDELPQLWDVLTGRMSLVGPLFALPREAAQFDEDLQRRPVMRPGIIGLWRIEARDLSPSAYRRLDLLYVDNWSLGLDLAILAKKAHSLTVQAFRKLLPRSGHRRERLPSSAAKPSLAETLEAAQRARLLSAP